MPGWLIGAVRTVLQVGWSWAAGWLVAHNVPVPTETPEWLTLVVFALVAGAFAGLIQWLERRDGSTLLGRLGRALARLLMLGARPAAYPREVIPPASSRQAAVRRTFDG